MLRGRDPAEHVVKGGSQTGYQMRQRIKLFIALDRESSSNKLRLSKPSSVSRAVYV